MGPAQTKFHPSLTMPAATPEAGAVGGRGGELGGAGGAAPMEIFLSRLFESSVTMMKAPEGSTATPRGRLNWDEDAIPSTHLFRGRVIEIEGERVGRKVRKESMD